MEQQLQLEQRQQRLYEEQLRLQEEQAMLQRHLQAQARSRVVVPEPVSPEDIAAASLLAVSRRGGRSVSTRAVACVVHRRTTTMV